ncbi:MAG TPA: hypothetical protein VGR37_00315 [Longimicrobiaceae bacterium]|nr:hypothetical protein [Longimicrobiaceae bacterium]
MSAAADPSPAAPTAGWERLERAAERAAAAVGAWRSRALEAEAEVGRLRAALEAVSREAGEAPLGGEAGELRMLRAENALLRSRAAEVRWRVGGLLARIALLEARR